MQASIFSDFNSIHEVAEALNVLKIVMNYARTTSPRAELQLGAFIRRIYAESACRQAEVALKIYVKLIITLKISIKNLVLF